MAIKLSILVPSVAERRNTFLPKSLDMLYGQYDKLPEQLQSQVEILYLIDNKTLMLGEKRNKLVSIAQGEYISFVDDDDSISPDYITEILNGIELSNADVITFKAHVSINGGPQKTCYYTNGIEADYNTEDAYYRLINHIPAVKKVISQQAIFPSMKNGEDSAYSKQLKQYINSQHVIDKHLYTYNYNDATTVAQEDLPHVMRTRQPATPLVDIIILSYAKTEALQRLTEQTITTCIAGACGLPINIIVLEQQPNITYANTTTIYRPQPFNYNGFANYGASQGTAQWILVANNDLIFHKDWLHNLLEVKYPIVSPKCPNDPRQKHIVENTKGYECGRHFSGWAFMIKRSLFNLIGKFEESVNYWCSDNVVLDQLEKVGIPPMLVPSSIVQHLQSQTLATTTAEEREHLTKEQVKLYNKLYNKDLFHWGT